MRIVPEHKLHFEACSALSAADDPAVAAQLNQLLMWLKDMNWPVALLVEKRIKSLGMPLAEPLLSVLKGSDDIWKYWVLSSLLPKVESKVVDSLRPELKRILSCPSAGEVQEGVVDAARSLQRGLPA